MALAVSIRFIGRRRFQRRMATAGVRFQSELEGNLHKAAAIVERAAKKNIRGSRTRAKRKGRPVTAPPNVLANLDGHLRRSITFEVERKGRNRFRAEIGPQGIKYARRHELGTGGMPKRPYLAPAITKNERRIVALIGRSFRVV